MDPAASERSPSVQFEQPADDAFDLAGQGTARATCHVSQMVLHGVDAEVESMRDVVGVQPVRGELQHLDLAIGQLAVVDLVEPAEVDEMPEYIAREV